VQARTDGELQRFDLPGDLPVPLGAPALCTSGLGVALDWNFPWILEPYGRAAGASAHVLCVPPRRDCWT